MNRNLSLIALAGSLALAACSTPSVTMPDAETGANAAMEGATDPTGGMVVSDSSVLDGKTFTITVTDKDGPRPDSLIFADGKFESTDCRQYGFTPTAYSATGKPDALSFQAVSTSEAEGKIAWMGATEGEKVKGTAMWTKEGQEPMSFEFEGTLAAADAAPADAAPAE